VTGQPIDIYLREAFFAPMGLNNTTMKMTRDCLRSSPREVPISNEMVGTAFVFNVPAIRSALLPAASLRSSARELGAFFTMLLQDGMFEGKRYLSEKIIRLATRSHYNGMDLSFNFNMNWGLGFIIGGGDYLVENPREWIMGWGSGNETFAGFGMGTCMVWADRKADLVTAFTCNGMLGVPGVDMRWAALSNAVWESLKDG
jgi:CubicO group peptidase (beta-lactamase class C family)